MKLIKWEKKNGNYEGIAFAATHCLDRVPVIVTCKNLEDLSFYFKKLFPDEEINFECTNKVIIKDGEK